MLLVCNGAPKSGSTWLYNVLTSLIDCRSPDARFLTGNSENPCIKPDLLGDFLQSTDISTTNYISKNHLAKPSYRDLLLANDDVYVFDIERDPKDVIVSTYYDIKNRYGYKGSFAKFYWTQARELIAELDAYHALWRNVSPRFHICSYEGLKNNFSREAEEIAKVLGLSLLDDEIERLHDATSMDKLRKKYAEKSLYKGDKFFRKGVVGDWQNHFDNAMLKDIEIVLTTGIRNLDRHHIAYRIRRWLSWHLRTKSCQ